MVLGCSLFLITTFNLYLSISVNTNQFIVKNNFYKIKDEKEKDGQLINYIVTSIIYVNLVKI